MPRRDEYDDDRYDDEDRPRRRDDREYDDGGSARRPDDREYDRYDQGYEDEGQPRRSRRDAARERVSMPAIFMMVVGGLGLAIGVFAIVIVALGLEGPNPFANPQQQNDPAFKQAEQVGKIVGVILRMLWGAIVFFGGLQMKNLKSRGFVVFSCIWAMLPCNECCLLGLPFGIWALVTVNDESVKRAF